MSNFNCCYVNDKVLTQEQWDAKGDDEMIIVRYFKETVVTENGETREDYGFIFTTKTLIKNLEKCHLEMNTEGIVLCLDGTFRLCINGYVLLLFGTDHPNLSGPHSHSFVPFGFAFCRAETTIANRWLIEGIITCFKIFVLKDEFAVVNVVAAIIDHSAAIRAALITLFPMIVILSCWAHVIRNARKNAAGYFDCIDDDGASHKKPYVPNGVSFFDEHIHPILCRIHLATNINQFNNLVIAFENKFSTICPEFVQLFVSENCSEDWNG